MGVRVCGRDVVLVVGRKVCGRMEVNLRCKMGGRVWCGLSEGGGTMW